MGSRAARLLRWCLVGSLVCSFALLAAVAFAQADPAPYEAPESTYTEPVVEPKLSDCPEIPESFDSAEAEYTEDLQELRWIRIDAAKTCRALAERSDLIAKRTWWAVVEAAEGRLQRSITNSKLSELVEAACAKPCPVSIDTDELGEAQTAELVSSIDSSGEALKAGLYMLVGIVVAGFVAFCLWKTTQRGV